MVLANKGIYGQWEGYRRLWRIKKKSLDKQQERIKETFD